MKKFTCNIRGLFLLISLCFVIITFISCSSRVSQYSTSFDKGNYYYFEKRNYKEALKHYSQVSENDVNYITSLRYIGYNIYCREYKENKNGLKYLEKAYTLNPTDKKVLEDLGRCYIELGEIDKGKKMLEEANTEVALSYLKIQTKKK